MILAASFVLVNPSEALSRITIFHDAFLSNHCRELSLVICPNTGQPWTLSFTEEFRFGLPFLQCFLIIQRSRRDDDSTFKFWVLDEYVRAAVTTERTLDEPTRIGASVFVRFQCTRRAGNIELRSLVKSVGHEGRA